MDAESLRPYLDWYKDNFSSIFAKHESYKWESVQTFQLSYIPDKMDYPAILKNSFRKSTNLLNSRSVFSLGMLLDITRFSKAHPEIQPSGIDIFFDLFEGLGPIESKTSLLSIISSFRKQIRQYVRTHLPDKKKDYQDLHAVSVYLNHRYPDTFYMYRAWEFTQFNKLIDNEFPYKWGADSNYLAYLDMCDELNTILRSELELDEGFRLSVQHAVLSDKKYYPDPEYHILTQDFIYSVTRYYKRDMIGRYAAQMKPKNLTPEIEYISVTDIKAGNHHTAVQVKDKEKAKIDYVLRQKETKALGDAGEEWVYEHEMKALRAAGRNDLANKVKWVAQKTDSKGYDILSFDQNGNEIYIEVKTTNGDINTPFFISAPELEVSHNNPEKYRLYRVYNFKKNAKIRIIAGDISLLNPKPMSYIVCTD